VTLQSCQCAPAFPFSHSLVFFRPFSSSLIYEVSWKRKVAEGRQKKERKQQIETRRREGLRVELIKYTVIYSMEDMSPAMLLTHFLVYFSLFFFFFFFFLSFLEDVQQYKKHFS
jgi:hypothetical protein